MNWIGLVFLMDVLIISIEGGEEYCEKGEINFIGGDIKTLTFTTFQACKEECAKTDGCVALTKNANICYLKNKDHAAEIADPMAISARMSCYEEDYCLKKGIHLNGGDISIAFTTVQACKEECAKTEGCVAFTTAAGTNNRCWLKYKGHAAESASATAISARMSCYEGNLRLTR